MYLPSVALSGIISVGVIEISNREYFRELFPNLKYLLSIVIILACLFVSYPMVLGWNNNFTIASH